MPIRNNAPWEVKDDKKLAELREQNFSYDQIASILGRSNDACRTRLKILRQAEVAPRGPSNRSAQREWTDDDLYYLQEMRRSGIPYKLIAIELERSVSSCQSKFTCTDWKTFSREAKIHDAVSVDRKNEAREKVAKSYERRLDSYKMSGDLIADSLVKALEPYNTVEPPVYKQSSETKKDYQDEDVVLILSDIHVGAYHTFVETGGLGEYNEEVLTERLRNLTYAVKDIHELHSHLYGLPTLHIACLGDIVAGMNASGEWSQNFLNMTITEQVAKGYHLISQMINYWLSIFPKINFYGIRGNHGRVAKRGIEKDNVNWDVVCYDFLQIMFKDNPRIDFHIPRTWWTLEKIKGHNFLMVHGDDIKGKGFPVKGLLDFEKTMAAIIRTFPDYTLAGHFHNSAELTTNSGRVIINGSVIGGDVFSLKTIHAQSNPEQTIFGVHEEHGMTWKYNINLKHPRGPVRGESKEEKATFSKDKMLV